MVFLTIVNFILFFNNNLFIFCSLSLISIIPISIFYYIISFQSHFISCTGGSNIKNFFLFNLFFDLINLISFTLRFFIQYIRIVLILLTFFLLLEFFINFNCFDLKNNISGFLLNTTRLIFEYIDFLIITTIQFLSFNILILWLLNFIFSNNTNNLMEVVCEVI